MLEGLRSMFLFFSSLLPFLGISLEQWKLIKNVNNNNNVILKVLSVPQEAVL